MTSEKQIEANRKNELSSTGPNNVEVVRTNAVKHGLTANVIFYKEDEQFIEKTMMDYLDVYPDDPVNRSLIELLAIEFLRVRKAFDIEQKQFVNSEIDSKIKIRSDEIFHPQNIMGNIEGEVDKTPCPSLNIENMILLRYSTSARNSINRIIFILEARNRNGFVSKK